MFEALPASLQQLALDLQVTAGLQAHTRIQGGVRPRYELLACLEAHTASSTLAQAWTRLRIGCVMLSLSVHLLYCAEALAAALHGLTVLQLRLADFNMNLSDLRNVMECCTSVVLLCCPRWLRWLIGRSIATALPSSLSDLRPHLMMAFGVHKPIFESFTTLSFVLLRLGPVLSRCR